MNGIKMKDCRFYVNRDRRTVVCVIPCTSGMVQEFIYDHFQFNDIDLYDAITWHGADWLRMPNSFVGKAVCSQEDEWDEEVGKLIAFSRAKDKCYKSFFKRANKFVQRLDGHLGDMITLFNDFGLKLENKRDALRAKIEDKIGTEIK